MSHPILLPLVGHFGLVFLLYAWLTLSRTMAVKRREVDYGDFEFAGGDPRATARIARNLANQFELPVILYACVAFLMATGNVETFDVFACWVFLAGRVAHTWVQTMTSDVRLRGRVFTLNFLAVVAVAGHVAMVAAGLA